MASGIHEPATLTCATEAPESSTVVAAPAGHDGALSSPLSTPSRFGIFAAAITPPPDATAQAQPQPFGTSLSV